MTQQISDTLYPVTINNLHLYQIQAFKRYPDLIHAIFTRHGGVSRNPYQSLNLSLSVGDDPEAVEQNFQKICRALNINPAQTAASYQIHGADVFTVTRYNRQRLMGYSDGLITVEPDVYLFMRFADCTPLIFFDQERGAIGLTHAGWRGTMQNAAGATVKAMVDRLDCQPQNIIAVIGPAIGPCCYEVGAEVIATAETAFPDTDILFSRRNGRPDHAHFDMWTANQHQLAAAGVGRIIRSELCTACRTDQFFSHRAEKGQTGRFGVILGRRGGTA